MIGKNIDCINFFSNHVLLEPWQGIIVTVYCILINGILGLVLNLLMIFFLIKTKQSRIPSMKIVFYISLADALLSVSFLLLIGPMLSIGISKTNNCFIELAVIVSIGFFGSISLLLIVVMSYHRYACFKYSAMHVANFKRNINKVTIVCISLAFLQVVFVLLSVFVYQFFVKISECFYLLCVFTQ